MDNFEQGSAPGFDQPPDMEPLIGHSYYGAEGAPQAEIRNWRAPVYCIFGYCTPSDMGAFVFGLLCPWCNFGNNMRRSLRLNAILEACIAFFCTVITLLIVHGTINAICPMPKDEVIPALPGFDADDPNPLCKPGLGNFFSKAACFEPHTYCYNIQYARYVGILVVGLFYCYVAYRRSQSRYAHGLPGNCFTDFCYEQWCCLCALCQETRTYWHYNVQDGEWLGTIYKGHFGEMYDDPYAV